jgi:hypothetical protein
MILLPARILISGVPACGKSRFIDWLVEHQSFKAFKVDESPTLRQHLEAMNVRAILGRVMRRPDAHLIRHTARYRDVNAVNALIRRAGMNVVLEMGFEPGQRGRTEIDTLIRAGFLPWWFEADEADARNAYLARRPDATMTGFRSQWDRIRSYLHEIHAMYPNRIKMIRNGQHVSPEEIARAISAKT